MRKIIIFISVFILSFGISSQVNAQSFSNSWINFNNTYFKFKVYANGIYRINKTKLDSMGLSSVIGNQFAIIREGVEIPIRTSTNGVFGASDYIEFYGRIADGKIDKQLYTNPDYQPNIEKNLMSDTAVYFLTYDNTIHSRYQEINNPIPLPTPTPAPYCWVTSSPTAPVYAYKYGESFDFSNYFYASTFDRGEGVAYNQTTFNFNTNGFVASSGQLPTLNFVESGQTITTYQRTLTLSIGSNPIFDTSYNGYFDIIRCQINIPISNITSTTTTITANSPGLSFFKMNLRYPRNFSFDNYNDWILSINLDLPANQPYIEISNFNTGGVAMDLYDLTNNQVFKGSINGNILKYYLGSSSSERNLFLPSSIQLINDFQQVQFRNYALATNQGDYIILSNDNFISATPNYLNDYKTYRASAAGGGHTPVIVNVNELYDQFSYGYYFQPSSIKNLINYANNVWTTKPEYLFIVGKGINYANYSYYQSSFKNNQITYPSIPTWGVPGSDNLFSVFNNNNKPILATGRLSAFTNGEINDYLEKVKSYEAALNSTGTPTVANDLWKKTALHVAGSANGNFQLELLGALNNVKRIYQDTLIGGNVNTISKSSTNPVDDQDNVTVDSLMNHGLNILSFYGHASASGFDFNLNNPNVYHSKPRFPIFFAFGCEVGDIFTATNNRTISENYVNSVEGGSIIMLAGDNLGYTDILPIYMESLYKSICYKNYGQTLGMQYKKSIADLITTSPSTRMNVHTQSILFIGDPAISAFNPSKPDYVVENTGLSINPTNVTTSIDSFEIKAITYNLGKAINDSVWIKLDHRLQGNNEIVYSDSILIHQLYTTDTIHFKVPINASRDVGLNDFTVTLDPQNKFDEISKQNNSASIQVFIYSDNIVPIYPYNFSIIHQQGITLKASTLNAFSPTNKFLFEIDTTEKFNSSFKQTTSVISSGGVVKWTPTLTYIDSTVYYWRTAIDSLENGAIKWTGSSFVYLKNGTDGWNQSHYYQYNYDNYAALALPDSTRHFKYVGTQNQFVIENNIIYPQNINYYSVNHSINGVILDYNSCAYYGGIQFIVIDSTSGQPWINSSTGDYQSLPSCQSGGGKARYEFFTSTLADRNNAMNFINNIVPNGDYIGVNNYIYQGIWDKQTITQWMADTLVNGSGISLYHAIKNLGFDQIDQFTDKRVFAFFRKKNDNSYPIYQIVAPDSVSQIHLSANYLAYPDTGTVSSTVIGPASAWQSLLWKQTREIGNSNDSSFVKVIGINSNHNEVELMSGSQRSMDLSSISATQYPNLKLKWYSVDSASRTSANLNYWRVLYKPVPEAALNANAYFKFLDSIQQGQTGSLQIAIENVTPYPMDSMLVKFKMIDANNVSHDFGQKRFKKLIGNDTLIANYDFNADAYPGLNSLFIEANPNNDQPEQYHPNNLGSIRLFVKSDATNPLLDVTFDGIHILDKDIVSAKPFIKIELKDDNKFLALNDSTLLTVQLMKPNSATPDLIPIDGIICKFIPAQLSGDKSNTAYIEYRPTLPIDGVYQLIVQGKDKSGNQAGQTAKYQVDFTVENKPSITNLLNYPNPFSTSTQFLFTLTGSEIPSQFKIQILTVTGKIIREITKNELGNLHIGRNITDYRWDGKDQFGQTLGNGVYLYRVVTSLQGNDVEHRSNSDVDQYFKNGYGKLYIMR